MLVFLYNKYMRKTSGWVNALFALVFIACPALVGFFLWVPYWENGTEQATWFYWVIGLSFLAYVALLCWFLIHFEWLGVDSLNFNIPIALVFFTLFVSWDLTRWIQIILVIVIVLLAFPVNMWTTHLKRKTK